MRWTTTGQHSLQNGVKVCVHGLSGAGKTRLIITAPRPLVLSAEGGTLSIASANLPVILISSMKDLIDAREWIQNAAESRQFDTICLDSVTEMAERLLSDERKRSKDPRAAYGEMQDQIATQLRLFRDLPLKNVYFSAKTEIRDQPDGTKRYAPAMPGKTASQGLPYYFDELFYLGIGEFQPPTGDKVRYRYLQTQPDHIAEAKDRSGVLDAIEQPDLNKIFTKIRTTLTSATQ